MLTEQEKENITNGFMTAGERMDSIEADTKQVINNIDLLADQLKRVGKAVVTNVTAQGSEYRSFWPDEATAKSFGKIVMAVVFNKALSEGVNTEGGYLVPDDMKDWMIQKLGQYGKYRRDATVVSLGSDRALVPKIESDLTIYCPGEGQTITEGDVTFSQVGLTAKKLCCLAKVSTELDEDSVIGIGEIVGISVARSMAKKEDLIGFVGDGTSTYFGMTGILGALRGVDAVIANIKGLKVGTGNAYSELTLDDFEGVVSILPDDADDGAKWYVNKKFFFSVMYKLARAAGAADLFAILTDKKERFFMGYPVEFVSCLPSTEANSQICALLGDLQLGAYLGERRVLTIEKSTDAFFVADQIGFRGTERIDVNAFGVGDTSEAGPIVGLITAAS